MLHYRVELGAPNERHFHVSLRIENPAAEQVLSLPAWIPGSYLLREFAKHLRDLSAAQGGRSVSIEQLDKASWRCANEADEALELRWRVYAGDNSVRAAFLDARRGFFNGTSLFLRVHGREHESHALTLAPLPAGWQVATALRETGALSFEAADYDELVDHPVELGTFWLGHFTAGGIAHRIAVSGALPSFDGERLLADAKKICEAQIAFWGEAPFPHYTFLLNVLDEGYGGLEHRASTALVSPRRDLPRLGQAEASEGYVKLLGLISHEYFHSWNVKRLRPAELARYDYTRENYTELLWFFEGFTSYYDDLFLLRAGLIDEARYLKLLGGHIASLLATPGRRAQSLAQASFEAWVKYYRPDENAPNSLVSYYGKGALLGLALDLSLRQQAGSSLDALMRALWRSSGGGPVCEQDIFVALAELGGAAQVDVLRDWVHGTGELPLQPLLEAAGVQWRADERATLAQRLGLRVSESALTGVGVKQVLAGSAGEAAGFCAGDEVLACNGWRLRRLDDALPTLGAGETALAFLVSRDQRLLSLTVGEAPAALEPGASGVTLSAATSPGSPDDAPALRRAWLLGG